MKRILSLLIIALTASCTYGYTTKVENKTPFKIEVECNLIAWPTNKSKIIEPYKTGEVNTVGWLTREVYIHVFDNKTGQWLKKFLTLDTSDRKGSRELILYAEPILKDNKPDTAYLYLVQKNEGIFMRSQAPISLAH